MLIIVLSSKCKHKQFLRILHLFYAGLFALVLPMICWGAQATPGHPHARAHFVFVNPMLTEEAADSVVENDATHPYAGHHDQHGRTHAASQSAKPQSQPAGRSTPAMSGISLLLLVGTATTLLPFQSKRPDFWRWFAQLDARPFMVAIPTPPPR
jgi:hypothetical protein